MPFDSRKHHRRSIRLKGYDYSRAGAYFVTVCTQGREHLLGRVSGAKAVLSDSGCIVEKRWRHLPGHFGDVELDEFVVMPNHIHGIIIINHDGGFSVGAKHLPGKGKAPVWANAPPLQTPHGTQPGSLGAIIQNFKSISTRKINQLPMTPGVFRWQRNYHEHIIRDEKSLHNIRRYIRANPMMWTYDAENPNRIERTPEQSRHLTRHCGFTNEELDFVINYDVEYRMRREDQEANEE